MKAFLHGPSRAVAAGAGRQARCAWPARVIAAGVFLLAGAPPSRASDRALRAAVAAHVPALDAGWQRMGGGASDDVQAGYDTARDMAEALRRSAPVSRGCGSLLRVAAATADAQIRVAEGIDRPDPAQVSRARAARNSYRARLGRLDCTPGMAAPAAPLIRIDPPAGAVAGDTLVARTAPEVVAADVLVDGRPAGRALPRDSALRLRLDLTAGQHDLRLSFVDSAGRPLGDARVPGVWGLESRGRAVIPFSQTDVLRERRLAALGRSFPGVAAFWVQDLRTGRGAGYNAGAVFPAASLTKLGLLAAGLPRLGPTPEASPLLYDLRAMSGWSSNLATNRLLRSLGGSEAGGAALAEAGLRRLGARSSTFPGGYVVGTELQPRLPSAGATAAPPRVSARVATAQDMGRMLFSLHTAALGEVAATARAGLSEQQARLGLGMLLSSEQRGDNVSLLAGGLPRGTPIAQKNGWLRASRHAAGIVYAADGPRLVVMLTYRESGIGLAEARALGARLTRIAMS